MAYPEAYQSTPDSDGDQVTIRERAVEHDLRFQSANDLAWVQRDDVPDMIAWLQAYYAASVPPKAPTTNGSIVRVHGRGVAHLIAGDWLFIGSGYKAYPDQDGFTLIKNAGEED